MVAGGFRESGEPAPTPEAPHWNLGFARARLEARSPQAAGG